MRDAARAHVHEALEALADIMKTGKSEASRIAAANAILERAHGKPGQAAESAKASPPERIELVIVDPKE